MLAKSDRIDILDTQSWFADAFVVSSLSLIQVRYLWPNRDMQRNDILALKGLFCMVNLERKY